MTHHMYVEGGLVMGSCKVPITKINMMTRLNSSRLQASLVHTRRVKSRYLVSAYGSLIAVVNETAAKRPIVGRDVNVAQ